MATTAEPPSGAAFRIRPQWFGAMNSLRFILEERCQRTGYVMLGSYATMEEAEKVLPHHIACRTVYYSATGERLS